MDNVITNKAESIEQCVKRINYAYNKANKDLENHFDEQDIVLLNLQRACEAACAMAAHFIRLKKIGLPKESSDLFTLLAKEKIISSELATHLKKMVGFRNIAVHEYQKINFDVVNSIIEKRIADLLKLSEILLKAS